MKLDETWDDRYQLINAPYLRYGVVTAGATFVAGVDSPAAVILINAVGGNVTLPLANTKRHAAYYIKNIAAGAATITPTPPNLIDGAISLALPAQYDGVLVVSDGVSNWFVIAEVGPSF